MNFPIEYPIFRFLFWLIDTAGVGGVFAGLVALGSVSAYALVLRWIWRGGRVDESETFAYPTPALHTGHD